jgi:protein required for attachment to host cells
MGIWILVASSSKACIYSAENLHSDNLELVEEFRHPESKEKGTDLITDRPGHFSTDHGTRGTYEKSDPRKEEVEIFARELAAALKAGRNNNKYNQLILIAPPHFYGLINKHINFSVDSLLHINKDYTHLTERDLIVQLHQHIYK